MAWLTLPEKKETSFTPSVKKEVPILSSFGEPLTERETRRIERARKRTEIPFFQRDFFKSVLISAEEAEERFFPARMGRNIIRGTIQTILEQPERFKEGFDRAFESKEKAKEAFKEGELGRSVKPFLKANVKAITTTLGSFAAVIFSPIMTTIGEILKETGGEKIIDDIGQTIVDKTGITDWPAFQRFVMKHPNAEKYFLDALDTGFLLMATGVKSKAKGEVITKEQLNKRAVEIETRARESAELIIKDAEKEGRIIKAVKPVEEVARPEVREIPKLKTFEEAEMKPTRLAERTREEAIERGIKEDFGELPEYSTMNMADQAAKARRLIETDFERAKDIINEKQPPVGDLRVGSVFSALKEKAIKESDIGLLMELTKSPINEVASKFGQEIKAFDSGLFLDPVRAITEVTKAKEAAIVKRLRTGNLKRAKAQETAKLDKSLKEATEIKPKTWEQFLDNITC